MALLAALAFASILPSSASAQTKSGKPAPTAEDIGTQLAKGRDGQLKRMVLEADLVTYNNDSDVVVASGSVHVYYDNKTLTSDKVTFFRKTRRVIADGNARLVNDDGTVTTGASMDVTQNFQEGFVRDLHVETTERSRFAAAQAERKEGNITVFDHGVYSACQTCVTEPSKPPFWQIKAAKIIHNQQEKTVTFENAQFELMGVPVAWLPYFWTYDPTVKRKSGFLPPSYIYSEKLGVGARVPYFWAPAPDWDVTLSPTVLSRQGALMDATLRHRTENGIWQVRGVGIHQNDPTAFTSRDSQDDWRGGVFTKAKFNLNDKWSFGWDAALLSDRRFASDYKYSLSDSYEASSQVYLSGFGRRNSFDARAYAFQVYTDEDSSLPNGTGRFLQDKQPIAATVDYQYFHDDLVAGGELSGDFNLTLLDRQTADLDIYKRMRGAAGQYSRASVDINWRREMIDSLGQVWKPFLGLRGDAFFSKNTDATNSPWLEDSTAARIMPTAGLEYRFPFLLTSTFGNSILEPIAQLTARTNEMSAGRLPNNDAQSLVFDDTNLFDVNKFSGWDRVEGGVRANIGAQYTFLANNGASISALFGESFHLAGTNSYSSPTEALLLAGEYANSRPLTGVGSGLDTKQSDYVARLNIDSGGGLRLGTQARFDNANFRLNRLDVQATGTTGPLTASITYAYAKTPSVVYELLQQALAGTDANGNGIDDYVEYKPDAERQEIQAATSIRATDTWRLYGSVRYDIVNSYLLSNTMGVGYDNDSFSASLSYIESVDTVTPYFADGSRNVKDRTFYLRLGFRTLGDWSTARALAND
jgi:LPS-assembly protein